VPECAALEILCQLKDREPQPVRALAAQLVSVSPTRASRLVQDLIDAGYLRRGADHMTSPPSPASGTS
jgi:DNA-binding IclR family transcriptional regulator